MTGVSSARSWQRRGTAAVEFAIAAPVLFLMVLGIVEFGRVMLVKNALSNAAREGCRRAALATTVDRNQVDAVVRRQITSIAPAADLDIDVQPGSLEEIASGTPIQVSVNVRYADVSWVPVDDLVGDAQLRASATHMRE